MISEMDHVTSTLKSIMNCDHFDSLDDPKAGSSIHSLEGLGLSSSS